MQFSAIHIGTALERNTADVNRLASFDAVVLELAISHIRELKDRLEKHHGLENPHLTAENTLRLLEGIHSHASLKPAFETIYNQCVVLLVSVFAAAVADLFRAAIQHTAASNKNSQLMKEELRFSVADVFDDSFDPRDKIGQLIADKKDLSFQDMKSIHRAFGDYFSVEMEKDQRVNDIIITQACRHIIVHNGGAISDRFRRQISSAKPRSLKSILPDAGVISFEPSEIELAGNQILSYFKELRQKVESAVNAV